MKDYNKSELGNDASLLMQKKDLSVEIAVNPQIP